MSLSNLIRFHTKFPKIYNIPKRTWVSSSQDLIRDETQMKPQRRFNRNRLGKERSFKNDGFLGNGKNLKNPARRWQGGRYNFFDWPTLVQAINNCPSVIEYDRMPSKYELKYYYRAAHKGVMHHGGYEVVAQILGLSPRRYSIMYECHFPTWIEEMQINKKTNEINNIYNGKAIGPPHRYGLPEYIKSVDQDIVNIQGKTLTRNDKRVIIRKIYKKINAKLYENDKKKRKYIQEEWNEYKKKIRNERIKSDFEMGLNNGYFEDENGFFKIFNPKESDHEYFDKFYQKVRTQGFDTHINLVDKESTHKTDILEKLEKSNVKGVKKITNKVTSLFKRKEK